MDVSKGDFRFPPAYLIEQNMMRFESDVLAKLTPCQPGPVRKICLAVAQVHAELLLIHPFRDGNGRIARLLANVMMAQAGLPIPMYSFLGHGGKARRAEYLAAVMKAYGRDYEDLAGFLLRAVERKLAAERILANERGEAPSKMDDS